MQDLRQLESPLRYSIFLKIYCSSESSFVRVDCQTGLASDSSIFIMSRSKAGIADRALVIALRVVFTA